MSGLEMAPNNDLTDNDRQHQANTCNRPSVIMQNGHDWRGFIE